VDGFRFDLASTLARELHDVDRLSGFFDVIQQDPVINQVKLIAEPWDVGEGGYQVGNFPPLWSEWNGRYRDTVRDFWRAEPASLAEFANRLSGSPDLYQGDQRRPSASINFITAHDGFTLNDLVSYNERHNEANGEHSRDGESHNRSWNSGAEGDTDDEEVRQIRIRQRRNFLSTLFLSQGVPMLLGGDEMGRTQRGNNNAYCQDNEISWFDWSLRDENLALLGFTRQLMDFRVAHPVLRRRRWFQGRPIYGSGVEDIVWFDCAGTEMDDHQWQQDFARSLGVFLNGRGISSPDHHGRHIVDDSLLMLFNAHWEPVEFTLPDSRFGDRWRKDMATSEAEWLDKGEIFDAGAVVVVEARSLMLLTESH
ncbi:MAG: glycogen debranching enzyme, partial [Actinomycetota bacterium]|nr:glycogen debranching enzyme [Actinomycetota bacterium]